MLADPQFQKLLLQRSWLRWGLSLALVVSYLAYSLAGVYASDLLGTGFMGSSISWWIVIGLAIMVLSIVLALAYVRIIRQLYAAQPGSGEH